MITTAHHTADSPNSDLNRSESFRINDRVHLCLQPLSDSEYRQAHKHLASAQQKQRTLNSILAASENQRGTLRNIRDSEPMIAS